MSIRSSACAAQLIEQETPDESDFRTNAQGDELERRWAEWLEKHPDLTDAERDVAAWAYNEAFAAGAVFGREWENHIRPNAT